MWKLALFAVLVASPVTAQSPPQPEQQQLLELMSCDTLTALLQSEEKRPMTARYFHTALGWWGRGFIAGAAYMVPGDKVQRSASDMGLSAEVVTARISTYCHDHPTDTPFDAIQTVLLQVMKLAK